ncbi:MAG: cytidylate kinase family protein [Bacteroidales bacterium]|nr:cytidylate kinase family protein [Bacteroidales bacterium]MBN2756965.1 cytidylate kinase family protein [Bacteroidales bacterium]
MFSLKKYLDKYSGRKIISEREKGPVVTISREYACSGKDLAMELTKRLNQLPNIDKKWTWINKEVFEGTSEALHLKKEKILHVFEAEYISTIDSIILNDGDKYYKSDKEIKEKIIEIVRSFAENGNTIIIGLAGAIITRDIKKSLHIRLYAPFDWRVKKAAKERNRSISDTIKLAIKIDRKRDNLKKSFQEKNAHTELFDLSFNVMTMTQNEIIDTIIFMMKKRKLI